MMPITQNAVRPWFEQYGATLNDAASFRHMIEQVERESAVLRRHLPQYVVHAPDIVPECEEALAAAEGLLATMRARLSQILHGAAA